METERVARMGVSGEGLFPLRLLGFGFFWGWLFLVAVSPSPLFGQLYGLGGTPFEVSELAARILSLCLALVFHRALSGRTGRLVLAVVSVVGGVAASVLLCLVDTPFATTLVAICTGVAGAAMFLMWLCFFGAARLGQTALFIALSYALGGLLCLGATTLGHNALLACAVDFPVASGASFALALRYASEHGAMDAEVPAEEGRGEARSPRFQLPEPALRLAAGAAVFAFAFALLSAVAVRGGYTSVGGPLAQSACLVAVAAVMAFVGRRGIDGRGRGLYTLYRWVPACMGTGLAAFALGSEGTSTAAGALVTFGYLLFEALSLNDYCNVAKTEGVALLPAMASVRLAASCGMLLGWLVGLAWPAPHGACVTAGVLGLAALLLCAAFVLNDGAVAGLAAIAGDRSVQENAEAKPDRSSLVPGYARSIGLSGREGNVLAYLIQGRTMRYTADELGIAESTARSHVHHIYIKADVHDRMELIDAFDAYCAEVAGDTTAR